MPYPPRCRECRRRSSIRWLNPEERICRVCLARSACGILGLLLAVFGFGMALWSLMRMGAEAPF